MAGMASSRGRAALANMDDRTQAVIDLGALTLAFGRVHRITYHPDGTTPETDTDHTVMLGLIACAFAERELPELDRGLIAQYALVHDLVEVYAGDTPTLRIDTAEQAAKAAREAAAAARLADQFRGLPWIADLIGSYEEQHTPEARYVRAVDKLLPKVTHLLNGLATLRAQGMGEQELTRRYREQAAELRAYAADFPPVLGLHTWLVDSVLAALVTSPPWATGTPADAGAGVPHEAHRPLLTAALERMEAASHG